MNHLRSMVRDIPVDELNHMCEKVNQAKNDTFGISYFVSDPEHCSELAYSVVGVTNDGSGHTQHFRNVFKNTSWKLRVI